MSEEEYAKYIVDLLDKKIHENKEIVDEKSKAIIESFDSYYNSKGETKDSADELTMIDEINYSKAISSIANRQLSRYLMMIEKPYFGRLDFKNDLGESKYYFGIESLIDDDNLVIYDWRSPVANLYYDSIMGKASYESPNGVVNGEVTLKRQYKFKNRKLVYYTDMVGNITDEILLDTLRNNDSMVMKNIVNTIQKEQNKVIRFLDDQNVLVLGVAGGGKTSIALHRIAYLMYKNALKYDANKVCFITPNNIFFNYVDNVLPELGEDNVINLTLNNIAYYLLKNDIYKYKLKLETKEDYFERVIDNKLSFNFEKIFEQLNEFLNDKMTELFDGRLGLRLKGLTFTKDVFKELYFNKFKRRNYNKRKKLIKEFLMDRISTKTRLSMDTIRNIDTFVNKLLPEVDYLQLYKEFLTRYNYNSNFLIKGKIRYEHIYPLIYLKLFFKDTAIFDKYNHLLVDEYQDLNIFERHVIDKIFICSKTYLGDKNQGLFNQDYNFDFDGEVVSLKNSYRSSKQIFNFLSEIIDNNGVNVVDRNGKEVETIEFNNEEEMLNQLIEEVKNYKGHSLGIITKSYKDSKELYNKLKDKCRVNLLNYNGKDIKRGIVIGCLFLTKGLEFEKVIVVDASNEKYNDQIDKNYLYIACSRAMHELSLYSVGELTKLINKDK